MPLRYIKNHARQVIAIGMASALFSSGGVFVLNSVIARQDDANRIAHRSSQRAYEAARDVYNAANILRNAQVDACDRANAVRRELNEQVAVTKRQRKVFLAALKLASGGSGRLSMKFAKLNAALRRVQYHKFALPVCEKIVPKVKLTRPKPPV